MAEHTQQKREQQENQENRECFTIDAGGGLAPFVIHDSLVTITALDQSWSFLSLLPCNYSVILDFISLRHPWCNRGSSQGLEL